MMGMGEERSGGEGKQGAQLCYSRLRKAKLMSGCADAYMCAKRRAKRHKACPYWLLCRLPVPDEALAAGLTLRELPACAGIGMSVSICE
jgi:hypothetical protein